MAEERTDPAAGGGLGEGPGRSVDAASAGRPRVRRALGLVRSGDDPEAGFRILFETYYRPLQRFFARRGLPAADAADLTQETFLGIYRGLEHLRRESRFEPWLYRIATTAYLKRLRSGSTAKRAGIEIPHDEIAMAHPATRQPPEQLSRVLADERRRAVRRAVQELPAQMRRCLILRIYHEYSYREIAILLKVKIGTVKAHLFQARTRLEEHVSAQSLNLLNGPSGGAR